ncbi:MAG: choice-of-anchor J domain-containing protein, partial [Alistipes sp.]|nr:choice-of-anchor J domain-containing protein [Alistipes sp.]
ADGNWQYVVSQFSLPADAEKLHIKFTDYVADKTTALPSTDYQYQAALRLDDFSLSIGGDGAVLDFNIQGGDTPGGAVKDIAGILAAGTGNYSIENAWVVATYARGCLVTDATGKYILCYLGDKAEVPAVGAVVKISGDVTEYAGLLQFGQGTAVTATGETKSVDLGTPVTMTGADLDAYVGKPEVKYAQYEGALAVSGYYYNVTVEGAQTAVGSLSYPDAAMTDAIKALDGKGIKVTGFLIGVSSGKFTNTMVTAVAATGNDPQPEPTPDPEPTPGSYLSESFANGQGNWTINDVNLGGLDFVWSAASYGNDKYMKASGYKDGPVATESWLISPEFSLAAATAPELTFNHTHKFAGTFAEELTVWATADNGANWEQLTIPTYGSNNDYTFVSSGAISLTKYVGKSIKIAFKYVSTTTVAGTWEVKDVVVAEPGTTVEPEPTPDPTPSDPNASEATITFANAGLANAEKVDGKEFKIGDFVTAVFGQGTASTPTAYYDASKGIRMYQNGSTLDIASSTKTIIAIEFTFDKQHWYFAPDKGTLSAEADVRTWTGEAHNVKFTSTGTDKDHRVYIKSIKVTYK